MNERRRVITRRLLDARAGFTLIELLVVIVVLAILMAVALPSYLGQRAKAQDSGAKQYLTVAYKAARLATLDPSSSTSEVGYGEGASSVSTRVASDIKMGEPELAGSVSGPCATAIGKSDSLIVVDPTMTSQALILYAQSKSGTVWRLDGPLHGQQTITKTTCAAMSTALPTISGTTLEGQTLRSTNGEWVASPPITYSYQWQRCDATGNNCTDIAGATEDAYTLVSTDVSKTLRVRVTATNAGGAENATSAQSVVVIVPSAVTAGTAHTCSLFSDGSVKCWGKNWDGQLGNGTTTNSSTPVSISGITTATQVSAGGGHTCALLSDGTVKCWGYNGFGQLGNGTTTNSSTPVSVSGISTATAISTIKYHTCARLSSGAVKCWGKNNYGQLGNGTTTDSSTPVSVSGISSGATAISTGEFHTCAVVRAPVAPRYYSMKCWGFNYHGELGNGTTTDSSTPVSVSGISIPTAIKISVGIGHACALLSGNTIGCWGYNYFGQLGNGTTTNSSTPVQVTDITTATQTSAGGWHTCALLSNGTVKCWGWNDSGQLGDGTTTNSSTPVSVVFSS